MLEIAYIVLLPVLSMLSNYDSPLPTRTFSGMVRHSLIEKGIDLAGHQKYSQALATFDEVIKLAPHHPAGYLNKAILLEVMSLDFEIPAPQPLYNNMLEKSIQLAERLLEANKRSAEAKYYLGMAHSYMAYYKFRDGENWISGLTHGLKAYNLLSECLELDPEAYDAMTAIGTYKYWKSRKMSFLTWTPLVSDERNAGINYLKIAESKSLYTAGQATNSLIWIYIEEERYNDAIITAHTVLKRYPQNRLFLWGLASAAEKKGDWKTAREAYQKILNSIDSEVTEPRYIEIQARAKYARMSYNLGERVTAKSECEKVIAMAKVNLSVFTSDGASRIKRRIADMEELISELK